MLRIFYLVSHPEFGADFAYPILEAHSGALYAFSHPPADPEELGCMTEQEGPCDVDDETGRVIHDTVYDEYNFFRAEHVETIYISPSTPGYRIEELLRTLRNLRQPYSIEFGPSLLAPGYSYYTAARATCDRWGTPLKSSSSKPQTQPTDLYPDPNSAAVANCF